MESFFFCHEAVAQYVCCFPHVVKVHDISDSDVNVGRVNTLNP
jgi:hypothetical protein